MASLLIEDKGEDDYDDYLWPGLQLGISKFCDCRTPGDPQFYLHAEAGCCRGGVATTGKRSRSSRDCKREGCGRCKCSKDNKCDALAVLNDKTGCHFCQQTIGPMAIRDDPKHETEHFPKCSGLNGLPYGWCFCRQLMRVEFSAQKKEWTMWSPTRIYSTLRAKREGAGQGADEATKLAVVQLDQAPTL